MKKCIYCGTELDNDCVIDFCDRCGISNFGAKVFRAIVENMQQARERGDLDQGNIS